MKCWKCGEELTRSHLARDPKGKVACEKCMAPVTKSTATSPFVSRYTGRYHGTAPWNQGDGWQ